MALLIAGLKRMMMVGRTIKWKTGLESLATWYQILPFPVKIAPKLSLVISRILRVGSIDKMARQMMIRTWPLPMMKVAESWNLSSTEIGFIWPEVEFIWPEIGLTWPDIELTWLEMGFLWPEIGFIRSTVWDSKILLVATIAVLFLFLIFFRILKKVSFLP